MAIGETLSLGQLSDEVDLRVASSGQISLLFRPLGSAESFVMSRPSACQMARDGRENIRHRAPSAMVNFAAGVTSTPLASDPSQDLYMADALIRAKTSHRWSPSPAGSPP
jgi:hypothetical protein